MIITAMTIIMPVSASGDNTTDNETVILNGKDWAIYDPLGDRETRKHYLLNYTNPLIQESSDSPYKATTEEQIIQIISNNMYDLSNPDIYYLLRVLPTNNGIQINLAIYDKVEFGDTLNYYQFYSVNTGHVLYSTERESIFAAQFSIIGSYLLGITETPLNVSNGGATGYDHTNTWLGSTQTCLYNAIMTNIPNITYDDEKVNNDGKTAPVPFTVTYSPELSQDMKNVVYIPSKGGGTIEQENNILSATVQLTDEFKNTMKCNDLGTDFSNSSYSVIGCLSTEPITKGTNLKSFFETKVVYYGYQLSGVYESAYENSNIGSSLGISNDRSNTIFEGITPIFNIPTNKPLVISFNISGIDFVGLNVSRDTPLYVNVVGIHARNYVNSLSNVSYTSASTTDILNLSDPFEIKTIKAKSPVDDDNLFESDSNPLKDTNFSGSLSSGIKNNNTKDVNYYYSYSVSSESFKYTEYPEYDPITLTDSNGNKFNPSTSSLNDLLNMSPNKATNTTLLSKGDKDSTLNDNLMDNKDFIDYKHDLTISNNFGSADFTNPVDLFNNSSTYFKFLTASLECLPDWFYSIFTSWFVIFLTLALIKYIFS